MKLNIAFGAVALCLLATTAMADAPPPTNSVSEPVSKAAPKKPKARCEAETGSRIASPRSSNGVCDRSPYLTRTYSAEDLKSTGQIDLGAALERLDPGFRR
ncbi:MAG: hypothetical protein V4709_09390 [Pseudomonadota bacterium]